MGVHFFADGDNTKFIFEFYLIWLFAFNYNKQG